MAFPPMPRNRTPPRTKNNVNGMEVTMEIADRDFHGLCFTNLVEFDQTYGHRNDVEGYAKALTTFDRQLKEFLPKMRDDDILIITNEVGRELYPYTPETRAYIETLGAVNAAIAAQCDAVYEFVAGTPIELKAPARPIPQLAFIQERTVARGGAA